MVRVVVDDRVRIRIADLAGLGSVASRLRRAFTHDNPQAGKQPDEPAQYETWREEDGCLALPRGLGMMRLREVLKAEGVSWTVEDARTWCHPEPGFPDHLRTLRPYQVRLRDAGIERQNCLLHGATGSGKTTALYGAISRLKRRSLVMLWTKNLLTQWLDRAGEELGLSPSSVGIIQGGKERIAPITLAMQQTITSRFERGDRSLVDAFDLVAVDEVQRGAAPTVFSAVDPFRARYRIGVSADHTRKDRKDFLIRDLFGEVAAEASEEETIAAGATVDVEIYLVPTAFRAPWYRYRQDFNKLLEQMVADEARNAIALSIARQVVEQGEQALLFTHRVEHARAIDAKLVAMGVQSGVMVGGVKDEVAFDRAKSGIKAGTLRAATGTYQAIAQGLDLPSVSRGICITPVANNRQNLGQVRGRICRSADGKDYGRLYVLWDTHVYGKRPVENLSKWFRTVKVWDGSVWIEARQWLLRQRGWAA